MERLQIVSKGNKAEAMQEIRKSILACCDEDIQEAFAPHGFTIEPLLMQIVRLLRGAYEPDRNAPASAVRATGDATATDYPTDDRESAAEEATANPDN